MRRKLQDYYGWEEAQNDRKTTDLVEMGELDENRPVAFMPTFSGEWFKEQVAYPVIVEMWDKVTGRQMCGSKYRRWVAEFKEAERNLIRYWYTRFYKWYLVTGTPRRIIMRLSTFSLLQRAVAFFATV